MLKIVLTLLCAAACSSHAIAAEAPDATAAARLIADGCPSLAQSRAKFEPGPTIEVTVALVENGKPPAVTSGSAIDGGVMSVFVGDEHTYPASVTKVGGKTSVETRTYIVGHWVSVEPIIQADTSVRLHVSACKATLDNIKTVKTADAEIQSVSINYRQVDDVISVKPGQDAVLQMKNLGSKLAGGGPADASGETSNVVSKPSPSNTSLRVRVQPLPL